MRSRISFPAVSALALALLLPAVAASPARAGTTAAAGNCGWHAWPSDRVCLISYGSPNIGWTILHVHTGTDGHDYADGEAVGANGSLIDLDVSRDGGRTYTGSHDPGWNTSGGWSGFYTSGTQYDGPGYWVRACATAYDGVWVCTSWN